MSDIVNWLSRFKKGDATALVPMARWPQRVNIVFEASIEVYSSMIKRDEDLITEGEGRRVVVCWDFEM